MNRNWREKNFPLHNKQEFGHLLKLVQFLRIQLAQLYVSTQLASRKVAVSSRYSRRKNNLQATSGSNALFVINATPVLRIFFVSGLCLPRLHKIFDHLFEWALRVSFRSVCEPQFVDLREIWLLAYKYMCVHCARSILLKHGFTRTFRADGPPWLYCASYMLDRYW